MSLAESLSGKSNYVRQRLLLSRELVSCGRVRKFLDVGCGAGTLLSMIGGEVEKHGVDVLPRAHEMPPGVAYLRHDVKAGLPYPEETFDVVHSSEFIEHLEDTESFLRECRRVLKTGGRLVVSTPNLHYWRNGIEWFLGNQFYFVDYCSGQLGHVRYFCPKTLSILANRAGFAGISTRTIGDWGGDNVFLAAAARLFQTFSASKNLILFLVATK